MEGIMKKKLIVLVILVLAGFLIATEAYSAWTQPKGHAYNQLTYGYFITQKRFSAVHYSGEFVVPGSTPDPDNPSKLLGTGGGIKRVKTGKFTSRGITYYGEYGITDTLTVFTSISWKETFSEYIVDAVGERGPSGIGDINLGLRYRLSNNLFGSGVVTSFQTAVKIPEAYDYKYPLTHFSMGDGQYDVTPSIMFGRGIGKGFAVLMAGYNYRLENHQFSPFIFKPSDQIKVVISGGYPIIIPKLQLRGIIAWTKSIGNASVSQEYIVDNYKYGGLQRSQDNVIIRDSLYLEPDVVNLGIGLAYIVSPKIQVVLSYNEDVDGIDIFETKDYGLGKAYNLALVYLY
jgi:hypothetical protein